MKTLVTGKIVQDFANDNKGKDFPIDDNALITPAAKDTANSLGIKFVSKEEYAKLENSKANSSECCLEPKCEASACTEEPVSGEKQVCCNDDNAKSNQMSYDRQQVVEAVIKVLAEKGLLDKILD